MRDNRQLVAWHQNASQVPCTKSPDIFPNLRKNHIKYHFSITKRENSSKEYQHSYSSHVVQAT